MHITIKYLCCGFSIFLQDYTHASPAQRAVFVGKLHEVEPPGIAGEGAPSRWAWSLCDQPPE